MAPRRFVCSCLLLASCLAVMILSLATPAQCISIKIREADKASQAASTWQIGMPQPTFIFTMKHRRTKKFLCLGVEFWWTLRQFFLFFENLNSLFPFAQKALASLTSLGQQQALAWWYVLPKQQQKGHNQNVAIFFTFLFLILFVILSLSSVQGYAMANQTTAGIFKKHFFFVATVWGSSISSDLIFTGIHFRLRARAFLFSDGQKRAVFVSTDSCMIFTSVKREVVKALQLKYGALYDYSNVRNSQFFHFLLCVGTANVHFIINPVGHAEWYSHSLWSRG